MSLNTDPYRINLAPAINTLSPVKVTLDGKFLGEASSVEVTRDYNNAASVDLKDLTGLADVSFYGHVYRDLRKTNKELEKKVRLADQVADSRGEDTAYWHNAYEVAAKKATERYMEIIRLKDELSRKAEPIDTLQLRYDVRVRDERIKELKAEVERLLQSRKEQAEKHNKKQANLQANFEQNTAGQEKARFLKKENSSLKRENALKQERNRELVAELQKLKAERDGERASADFWYEKSLGAQEIIESQGDHIEDVEAWKTAYKVQKEQSVARREALDRVTVERDQLLADINSFMEDFAEGATVMNRAVEDWNEKTDG